MKAIQLLVIWVYLDIPRKFGPVQTKSSRVTTSSESQTKFHSSRYRKRSRRPFWPDTWVSLKKGFRVPRKKVALLSSADFTSSGDFSTGLSKVQQSFFRFERYLEKTPNPAKSLSRHQFACSSLPKTSTKFRTHCIQFTTSQPLGSIVFSVKLAVNWLETRIRRFPAEVAVLTFWRPTKWSFGSGVLRASYPTEIFRDGSSLLLHLQRTFKDSYLHFRNELL